MMLTQQACHPVETTEAYSALLDNGLHATLRMR